LGQVGVKAVTDVTGFSLLGHGYEMAEKGGVQLQFAFEKLPFVSGALAYADDKVFPAGSSNNQAAYEQHVDFGGLSEDKQLLLFTPETSGGLLAAVSPDQLEALLDLFEKAGHGCWVVGEVAEGEGVVVV
jgi:selenide,water dikinase